MISRFAAELLMAAATCLMGLVISAGALEFGIGWGDAGPEAGAFPFYVGVMIMAASLGTMIQTLVRRPAGDPFLDRERAGRVAVFFGPMVLFVVAAMYLGLYVAMAGYLFGVMRFQGGYRSLTAAFAGISAALFFYVLLEIGFKVSLMKGPLEAALGLY